MKQHESAQSSSAVDNNAKVEPRTPKRKQSVITQDNQSMECSQAEEPFVASNADENTEPRFKTPRTEQTERALSSPSKDVDKCTEVINIDDVDHSQCIKKLDHNNSVSQANGSSDTTDVSMTVTQLSTAAEQSTQPNQYNHQKLYSPKILAQLYTHFNKGLRLKPSQKVEKRIRSTKMETNLVNTAKNPSNSIGRTENLSTSSAEQLPVLTQNQFQNDPQVLMTHTGNSRDKTAPLRSIGMISQEIHGPSLINFETSNDLAAVNPRNVLQNVNNAAATSQQLPSLSHKPSNYLQRLDEHQNSVAHEQYCTQSYQNQYLPTNQNNFQQKLLGGFTKSTTYDRPTSQTINLRIPSNRQNSTYLSNPQRTTENKNRKQVPPLQRVTVETLSPILTNLLNSLRRTLSTTHNIDKDNNVDLTTSPQNIKSSETSGRKKTEKPSRPIYQPSRIQHTYYTAHENGCQNLCTQKQTNSKTKRVHFMDDAAMSAVAGSHLSATSDSDSDEAPAGTTNNVCGAANEPGHASEGRDAEATATAGSSNQDQHRNEVADKTTKKKHKKLFRFILPPEYDAYDSRWTLKYRTYLAGLVELTPGSGVYVSLGDLKYCQEVSRDCASLALRLLPEVFNRNALSVCLSLRETAQASNSVGSKIRPDLDDHACSVLLNFVIEHGLNHGWNTDLKPILDILHSKIEEIRFKYGILIEC